MATSPSSSTTPRRASTSSSAAPPCQAFSVAGLRQGLADPRGSLTLDFLRLARTLRPKWIVWENVPGVLSQDGGRAFGALLGGLEDLGYGWAYRVLDAQFFGLAQRRKRVFVVGCAGGDFARAAAVLLEPEGVRRNPPARRASRQDAATNAGRGAAGGGEVTAFDTTQVTSRTNRSNPQPGDPCHPLVSAGDAPLMVAIQDVRGLDKRQNGCGWSEAGIAYTVDTAAVQGVAYSVCTAAPPPVRWSGREEMDPYRDVDAPTWGVPAVCFKASHFTRGKDGAPSNVAPPLSADADRGDQDTLIFTGDGAVADPISASEGRTYTHEGTTFRMHNCVGRGGVVRRLTPTECERLQGFPDGWTDIPYRGGPAADGPRYKALGNSMAVPVMRWIGERIAQVDVDNAEERS